MACHLFLVSTPLNMLVASLIASTLNKTACTLKKADSCILAPIDQPNATPHQLFDIIKSCPDSPFSEHTPLSYKVSGARNKVAARKSAFARIQALSEHHRPEFIYTGNDRRVEFQYAMHCNEQRAQGIYMDDGTYSYVGKKSHWFLDQIVDKWLKKLTYGGWWRQPAQIGESSWISTAYLFRPADALPHFQRKDARPIPPMNDIAFMKSLGSKALAVTGLKPADLAKIRQLLLIPHESVLSPGSVELLCNALQQPQAAAELAIKKHPRSVNLPAPLASAIQSYPELPASVPLEMLLPFLQNCRLAGERSTVLLTARWMRPDLVVASFAGSMSPEWQKLLADNQIPVIGNTEQMNQFLDKDHAAQDI